MTLGGTVKVRRRKFKLSLATKNTFRFVPPNGSFPMINPSPHNSLQERNPHCFTFESDSPWPRTSFSLWSGFCSWSSLRGPLLASALESGSFCRYDGMIPEHFASILSCHASLLTIPHLFVHPQPFEAVFGFVKQITAFLEKLITWPRECGQGTWRFLSSFTVSSATIFSHSKIFWQPSWTATHPSQARCKLFISSSSVFCLRKSVMRM